jgi:type 1 fimbria pilin
MHHQNMWSSLSVLLVALALDPSGFAHAANQTGTLTVVGSVMDQPPPASCNILSMPIGDATYSIPAGGIANFEKHGLFHVNCTPGLTVQVATPAGTLINLARGDDPAGITVGIVNGLKPQGANLGLATPQMTLTGTGTDQSYPLNFVFKRKDGGMILPSDKGTVSGSVPITLTY